MPSHSQTSQACGDDADEGFSGSVPLESIDERPHRSRSLRECQPARVRRPRFILASPRLRPPPAVQSRLEEYSCVRRVVR